MISLNVNASIPNQIVHEVVHTIGRGEINTIDWHPAGNMLAVGGKTGVWLYTDTLDDVAHWSSEPVDAIVWSPHGDKIVTGDREGRLRVWDVETGLVLHEVQLSDQEITLVAWQEDLLATGGYPWVRIWDATDLSIQYEFELSTTVISAMVWSPDGATLAFSALDTTLRLWHITTQETPSLLWQADPYSFVVLGWSPDGRSIACGSGYNIVLVDTETGEPHGELSAPSHNTLAMGIAWQETIISVGLDLEHNIWSETGDLLNYSLAENRRVSLVAWDPLAARVAVVEEETGTIFVFGAYGFELLHSRHGHYAHITDVRWQPGDETILVGLISSNIDLWNSNTVTFAANLHTSASGERAVWNHDGSVLYNFGYAGDLEVWDITAYSSEVRGSLQLTVSFVLSAAWNQNGTQLALVLGPYHTNRLVLWDRASGSLTVLQDQLADAVCGLSWLHNQIVTIGCGSETTENIGAIRFWGTSGDVTRTLNTPSTFDRWVEVMASPNGELLAVHDHYIQEHKTLQIINLEEDNIVAQREWPDAVTAADWHPDGTMLAVATGMTIQIWDSSLENSLATLSVGDDEQAIAVDWNSDGTQLAAGTVDGLVKIWSVAVPAS